MKDKLYSSHAFLFPFQWYFVGKEMKEKTLEERTQLCELCRYFEKTKNWERTPYKIDTVLKYNEYNYFYGMVREVLFDEKNEIPENQTIIHFQYKIPAGQYTYKFKVSTDFTGGYKEYSLLIDSIIVHLYSTGVGILSFHLLNRSDDQKSPDDILRINQAGRRIYPPFFGIDGDLIVSQSKYEYADFGKGLKTIQTNELALDFTVISEESHEDFGRYCNADNFKKNPFQLPEFFKYIFNGIPFTVNKSDYKNKEKNIYLSPLLDDRMFVICWYGNNELSDQLKAFNKQPKEIRKSIYDTDKQNDEIPDYLNWWYKYMFNDESSMTCQNSEMQFELTEDHSYLRWSNYGTLYGINRYSFVCLTSDLETLRINHAEYIVNHMQTMYYRLCELCLVQRACVIRFSDEVAGISAMNAKRKLQLSERVSNLYQQYLKFINRIYFREVTAQEQGIEMYDMMQKHMRIGEQVKDLDQEIQELNNFSALLQQQRQNNNIELITIIGAIFILPSFITGFFGMDMFSGTNRYSFSKWIILLLPLWAACASILWFYRANRKKNKESIDCRRLCLIVGTCVGTMILIGFIWYSMYCK